MRENQRIYFWTLAACIIAVLAISASLNLLVDPIGAYPSFSLKKIQPWRERITSHAGKAELLMRGDCEVLILGSSRMLVGIPVDDPAYGTTRVYNLGLNATNAFRNERSIGTRFEIPSCETRFAWGGFIAVSDAATKVQF